jgi:uncharacterized membrane protein YvlD (DUF360 family)
MKVLISIIFNALILLALEFLLWGNLDLWLESWIIVKWWWKTYIIGWIILWLINVIIKPILKILTLPFFFLSLFMSFVVNFIILCLFDRIVNNILMIEWVSYEFNWWIFSINFVIAVAIFTILNTLYSLLFFKK